MGLIHGALALLAFTSSAFAAGDIGFDFIAERIRSRDLRTLEDVLAELPVEYRQSWVAAYDSRSLQGATRQAPRVVFFGDRARLLLAFNGDPEQMGYYSLEAMEFREKEARFELHEVVFSPSKDRPRLSNANPEKCLQCHRADPRPNWESYNTWPGFYGSGAHVYPSGKEHPGMPLAEEADWVAFAKAASAHPRYRYLEQVDAKFRSDSSPRGYNRGQEYRYDYERHSAPATLLSNLLIRRNAMRMTRLLREAKIYPKARYAILGALNKCPDIETFLPESRRASWPVRYEALFREVQALENSGGNSFEQGYDDNPATISKLRFLMEPSGVAVKSFSMAFRHPPFGFVGPDQYKGLGILEPLLAADAELRALDGASCDKLRALSHTAWEG